MAENIDQDCLTILQRLQQLPPRIYLRKYPITTQPSHNITPTTIIQAYTHINEKIAKGEILTITNLQTELPNLPQKITQELIKCTQQVRGYTPNTNPNTTNHIQTNTTSEANPQATTLRIITWNTGCISSSLPGIQELTRTLHTDPHIILIQETKLHKLKSTTYIDRKFQNYKIIYNNSNNETQTQNRYSGPTQARGGILAMIPKNIYTNENITKIPTPSPISPYLQIIVINNKPLTPITIINMYMPTHPQDSHLISEIQNQIQLLTTQHPNHQIILAGDFNRDILLKGRTSNGTHLPPNQNDLEWAHFIHNIGLITINNQHSHTRQGGLNYTSTSHIDGFYSNFPNHNHLTCYTLDNLNQNSDHYPIQLNLHPNSIVIKEPHPHTNNPRITYPIHPANLQKLQTIFMEHKA
jgi:exonuclease III